VTTAYFQLGFPTFPNRSKLTDEDFMCEKWLGDLIPRIWRSRAVCLPYCTFQLLLAEEHLSSRASQRWEKSDWYERRLVWSKKAIFRWKNTEGYLFPYECDWAREWDSP
jgi:hypothetical protein